MGCGILAKDARAEHCFGKCAMASLMRVSRSQAIDLCIATHPAHDLLQEVAGLSQTSQDLKPGFVGITVRGCKRMTLTLYAGGSGM